MDFNGRRFGPAGVRRGVRVEGRDASWTPADITGVAEWWRADLGTDATEVGSWTGQIAGETVTQATAGAKPNTETRDGQTALYFDNGDWLQGAFSTLGTLAQPNTIVIVLESSTIDLDNFLDGNTGVARHAVYQDTNWKLYAGAVGDSGIAQTVGQHALVGVFNTTSSSMRVNDFTSPVTGLSVGSQSLDGISIGAFPGGSNPYTGWIWEVIVIDQVIDAADVSSLGAYLDARYAGLSLTY